MNAPADAAAELGTGPMAAARRRAAGATRRRAAGLALAVLVAVGGAAGARTVTDSAGRRVEVPDSIERIFAAGPPASVLVYVLEPSALLGWPRALRAHERPYIAAPYRDLPETGRLTGRGGEANLEIVIASRPDLIVDFGSIRDTYVSLAERVQAQTGIPYLLIGGRFDETPAALRLLGAVAGEPARGERLARYAERTFATLDRVLADVPEAARPRVYLARGPDGLETGLAGSINTEIIERAGGRNVADPGDGRRGIVRASMEAVLTADPDTIITWDGGFFERVWGDPLWQRVDAVRRGRVFLSPSSPFGWIDRPPSLNRLIGLRWLAGLFYPGRWPHALADDVREFYRLFYHVDLSDAELEALLRTANGRRR